MSKKLSLILVVLSLVVAFSFPGVGAAADPAPVLYWVSHGSPADPVWTYYLDGAKQWAEDTGIEVRTSFHSGDVPSQQEAIRAAIAAEAAASSPRPRPGQPGRGHRRGACRRHPGHHHQHRRPDQRP